MLICNSNEKLVKGDTTRDPGQRAALPAGEAQIRPGMANASTSATPIVPCAIFVIITLSLAVDGSKLGPPICKFAIGREIFLF